MGFEVFRPSRATELPITPMTEKKSISNLSFYLQAFRGGLHLYLTQHKYKNTFTEDLWVALEEVSKKPVRAVMSTWTLQLGFPVISVTSSEQVGSSRVLTLTQEKFVADAASLG